MERRSDTILLINDLPGYGKVALSAMMPVLIHMGFDLCNLPTALVSNTLDYGKFEILDTTDYMKKTVEVWQELGFQFDAISTGFIVSAEQVEFVAGYCQEQARKGSQIFVDPIMGDNGKLYNGVSTETIHHYRQLASVADYIIPNYTEATFLADIPANQQGICLEEAQAIIEKLLAFGAKNVIITSVPLKDEQAVIGYDAENKAYFSLPFDYVPVRFPGTGDIFSSIFTGKILQGTKLQEAAQSAMDAVRQLIILNQENQDKFKGIPIESYLKDLFL